MRRARLALPFLLLATSGCFFRSTVVVYTSLPREVITEMTAPLHTRVTDADVQWVQASSEQLTARILQEAAEGSVKADLIVSCDPMLYQELKQTGKLLPYDSPAAAAVPERFRDPDHAFTTVRLPFLVLAYNSQLLKPNELPAKWKDLSESRYRAKLSMGNPSESTPYFFGLAMLVKEYGWDYFRALRRQELVSEGASTAVVSRIESGERPLGMALLETVLKMQGKGRPVRAIYPLDGVIPVPCPIALSADSSHSSAAKQVYDWFFGPAAQNFMVRSGMYSPFPKFPPPDQARPLSEVLSNSMVWTARDLLEIFRTRDQIRGKFSEIVLH
ncbi:MAG: extracellular solute-binding protein [Bdellovibrionota bacterium]